MDSYPANNVFSSNSSEVIRMAQKYSNWSTDDEVGSAFQMFSKLLLRYDSECQLVKTKMSYFESQLQIAIEKIKQLMDALKKQEAKILEKQVNIEVEIEHTKSALQRWKQGMKDQPYDERE